MEHPQSFIDSVQYGERDAGQVQRGRGRIPVADYRLAASVRSAATVSPALASWGEAPDSVRSAEQLDGACMATAPEERSVFSFCMCPGGVIAHRHSRWTVHSCITVPVPPSGIISCPHCSSCRANCADQHFRGRALCQRHVLQVRCSQALLLTCASSARKTRLKLMLCLQPARLEVGKLCAGRGRGLLRLGPLVCIARTAGGGAAAGRG